MPGAGIKTRGAERATIAKRRRRRGGCQGLPTEAVIFHLWRDSPSISWPEHRPEGGGPGPRGGGGGSIPANVPAGPKVTVPAR